MTISPRDSVLDALSGERGDRPPAAVFTQSATVGQMERTGVSWPEAHSSPHAMAVLGAAQADLFGFPTVRVPFCVSVEAGALGCPLDMGTVRSQPTVLPGPFSLDPLEGTSEGSDLLPSPGEFVSSGRPMCVAEAVSELSRTHGDCTVVAGVTGMLTCMSQMFGAESLVLGALTCPDLVRRWSDLLCRRLQEYIGLLTGSGADVITLGEAAASPDVIDPAMFDNLTGDGLHRIFGSCDARTCLHICGGVLPILGAMEATGADSLSLEGSVDPYRASLAVGGRIALVGNVGPVDPLLTGSPADVRESARRSEDAGFDIIAPGCGVPPMTPDINMRALAGYR